MTKTYIFDLDGTLTDPRHGITRCLVESLLEVEATAPAGDLTRFIGPPLADTMTLLAGDPTRGAAALVAYRRMYSEGGLFENEVYPGVHEMLEALAPDAALYVATSKPRVYAERILEHFDLSRFFDSIHGAELSGERAHKVELLAYVREREAITGTAVMIGDREHDVIAARANGMRSVGVTWGFGSRDELAAAGADAICASPHDLAALLRTL